MAYDLDLFERLDAEFRGRPVRAAPVPRDPEARREKAERRLATMERQLGVPFADRHVLELGCGHGWQTRYVVELAGAAGAIGVDVTAYPAWTEVGDGARIRLVEADMSEAPVVEPASIDLVVSGAVFEHVRRPVRMLAAVHEALRPGGRAWLYFNLYRGPQASHRYNEIHFPWPHLLFDEEVCRAWYAKHRDTPEQTFAWVNRMTLAEYLAVAHELGFEVELCHRRVAELDLDFYRRFEDELGRYPALDLETDFATLVLRRPVAGAAMGLRGTPAIPQLDYVGRQRALDSALGRR